MVSKLQLEGLPSECLAKNLVSHADSEDGLLSENLLGVLDSVRGGRRITLKRRGRMDVSNAISTMAVQYLPKTHGSVAEEDSIRVHLEHLGRRVGRGHHCDAAAIGRQSPEDVVLDAEIIGHNLKIKMK